MYAAPEPTMPAVQLPPCDVCGSPAPARFWTGQLCKSCYSAWFGDKDNRSGVIERAWAEKHPGDVEARGDFTCREVGTPTYWVMLKPKPMQQAHLEAAQRWVSKARRARSAA